MKLNFWRILNGNERREAAEIAAEVAKLEAAIEEQKKILTETNQDCTRLRQADLGGGKVTKNDLETARKRLEEARYDLETLESALSELRAKLKNAAASELDQTTRDYENERLALKEQLSQRREDLIKAAAKVRALQIAIEGKDSRSVIYDFSSTQEQEKFLREEVGRLLEEQERPTYFEKEMELQNKREALKSQSVDALVEKLLDNARSGIKETVNV